MTKRKRPSRRRRPATRIDVRRRAVLVAAAATVPVGLLISVHRSAEGAKLAEALSELRVEQRLLEEQLSYEIMRVDSLSSLRRITGAAHALGLREAADDEVVHVVDVESGHGGDGDG